MKKTATILAMAALAVMAATPVLAAAKKPLTSPRTGVLCDRYMCADANGISRDLTVKFLGERAGRKLLSQGAFDTSEFTFANGVFCSAKEKACHRDRYFDAAGSRSPIDAATTSALFGRQVRSQ